MGDILLASGNVKEIVEELRKDFNFPKDGLIIILHIDRTGLDKLEAALKLCGYNQEVGALYPKR